MNNVIKKHQLGFTLIEILVVISIIGILAGLLITNFVGVRGRASDARRKNDSSQLKTALRLYYNDNQNYPSGSGTLMGCGDLGASACSQGGVFSTGGVTVAANTYMKELPEAFSYYSDGNEEFLIVLILENASDTDIVTSQSKCNPNSRVYYIDGPIGVDEFVFCED